jgi:hypothetical protein
MDVGTGDETDEDNADEADAPTEAPRAGENVAGSTSLNVQADFQDVAESDDARILAPGVDLRITGVAQLNELDTDVYEDATGFSVSHEGSEPPHSVAAEDNQQLLAVTYTSGDPQWLPRDGSNPDSTASIVVEGNVITEVFNTRDGTMHEGTIIASVPADASDTSVALEVETDGKFQSLSLFDGARLDSDVEHIYEAVDVQVDVTDAPEFEETFEGWTGDTERIGGRVTDAFVAPWLSRDSGGSGWASSGQVYLSVELDWLELSASAKDETQIHVVLDSGSTVQPNNDPSDLLSAFANNAVFQIPAETTEATVVLTPQVMVGGSRNNRTEWDPFSTELSFTVGGGS